MKENIVMIDIHRPILKTILLTARHKIRLLTANNPALNTMHSKRYIHHLSHVIKSKKNLVKQAYIDKM